MHNRLVIQIILIDLYQINLMVKLKKILSFLFVVFFTSYYAGTACFSYSHIVYGTSFIYSHFHIDPHHDNQKSHIEQDIVLIACFFNSKFIDTSCLSILTPLRLLLYENKFIRSIHWATSIHLENLSLRAPPVV